MYVHRRYTNWHGSPRWQRTLRHRGPRKTVAQLQDNPEERERRPKRPKNPSNRLAAMNTAIQLVGTMSRFPVRTKRGHPSEPSRRKYEIFPKARGLTHERSTNTAHRILFRFSSANCHGTPWEAASGVALTPGVVLPGVRPPVVH